MPIEHQEDVQSTDFAQIQNKVDEVILDSDHIKSEAAQNADREVAMGALEAIRRYPMAIVWSMILSASLIMEGFDHSYITAFYGFTEFQKHFGEEQPDGSFAIPAKWQTAISDGVITTEILGLLLVGSLTERFGYRWMMIVSNIMMIAFIFIQYFSDSLPVYLVAELLLGIPWGFFQTITTTYAAEVCPVALRGYMTIFVALCWTLGYLIGNCTLRGLLNLDGVRAYKIAFALQWIWPVPIIIGCYFAPESPWLLVRRGQKEDAYKSARRLASKRVSDREVEEQVAMMIHTENIERETSTAKGDIGAYWELFKGKNFRRTEICIITYCIQNITNPIGSYGVVFLEQAGMSSSKSFDFSIGGSAISVAAVFVSWFLTERRVSRRNIFLFGVGGSLIAALIVGFIGVGKKTNGTLYAMAIILLIESFITFLGVNTTTYPICAELPSNALRSKTLGLSRAVYNVVGIVDGILVPRMVNKGRDEWNWGAKSDLYFAGWLAIAFVYCYFRLPDASSRTYAEIDILFENNVPARKFRSTIVNVADGTIGPKAEDPVDQVTEKA